MIHHNLASASCVLPIHITFDDHNFYHPKFLQPLPQFYKQLLDMWYSINNVELETISEVVNESIWLNELIIVGNVSIRNKTWTKAGISKIV